MSGESVFHHSLYRPPKTNPLVLLTISQIVTGKKMGIVGQVSLLLSYKSNRLG